MQIKLFKGLNNFNANCFLDLNVFRSFLLVFCLVCCFHALLVILINYMRQRIIFVSLYQLLRNNLTISGHNPDILTKTDKLIPDSS